MAPISTRAINADDGCGESASETAVANNNNILASCQLCCFAKKPVELTTGLACTAVMFISKEGYARV